MSPETKATLTLLAVVIPILVGTAVQIIYGYDILGWMFSIALLLGGVVGLWYALRAAYRPSKRNDSWRP